MGRWDRRNFGKAGGFMGYEDEGPAKKMSLIYDQVSNYTCTRTENSCIHDDIYAYIYDYNYIICNFNVCIL